MLGPWSWKSASFILMFSACTQALPSPINTVICIHSERMRNWDWSQETLIDLVSYVSLWRRQCFNSFRSSKVLVSCYPRKLCHPQWILFYSCIYKILRCWYIQRLQHRDLGLQSTRRYLYNRKKKSYLDKNVNLNKWYVKASISWGNFNFLDRSWEWLTYLHISFHFQ